MTKKSTAPAKDSIRKLTVISILSAITAIMVFTPLGMIPIFGVISATTCLLPCLIGLLIEGPMTGGILGLVFGLLSMLKAYISPMLTMDPMFQNPLVSVLPRVIVPLAAWQVYRLMASNALSRTSDKYIGYTLASIAGSVLHTLLVLLMVALFNGSIIKESSADVPANLANNAYTILLWLVAIPSGIPEAILCAIAVPPIVTAVSAVKKRMT